MKVSYCAPAMIDGAVPKGKRTPRKAIGYVVVSGEVPEVEPGGSTEAGETFHSSGKATWYHLVDGKLYSRAGEAGYPTFDTTGKLPATVEVAKRIVSNVKNKSAAQLRDDYDPPELAKLIAQREEKAFGALRAINVHDYDVIDEAALREVEDKARAMLSGLAVAGKWVLAPANVPFISVTVSGKEVWVWMEEDQSAESYLKTKPNCVAVFGLADCEAALELGQQVAERNGLRFKSLEGAWNWTVVDDEAFAMEEGVWAVRHAAERQSRAFASAVQKMGAARAFLEVGDDERSLYRTLNAELDRPDWKARVDVLDGLVEECMARGESEGSFFARDLDLVGLVSRDRWDGRVVSSATALSKGLPLSR